MIGGSDGSGGLHGNYDNKLPDAMGRALYSKHFGPRARKMVFLACGHFRHKLNRALLEEPVGCAVDNSSLSLRLSASDFASLMIHSDFRWATGVECSFIPHLGIDQYRWTQHDRFWRDGLRVDRQRPRLPLAALRPAVARDRTPAGAVRLAVVRRPARRYSSELGITPHARSRALRRADLAAGRLRGRGFPRGAGTFRPRLRRTLRRPRADASARSTSRSSRRFSAATSASGRRTGAA